MWPISLLATTAAAFVVVATILMDLPDGVEMAVDSRTGKECVNDTQTIWDAESAVLDDSNGRTYHLCSDTLFPVGVYDGGSAYENGMPAIVAFRANLHIVCGDDGQRDNNCTLSGGDWHVEVGPAELLSNNNTDLSTPELVNLTVSGVTFTNATDGNVYLWSDPNITSNQITFTDCLFANNNAFETIYADHPNSNVNVFNCSFLNNTIQASDDDFATAAILRSEYAPKFNVMNCDFRNNNLTTDVSNQFSAIISGTSVDGIPGTELNISDSCFVNNIGITFAPIVMEQNASIADRNNFLEDGTGAVTDIDDRCNGIGRIIRTGSDGSNFTAECVSNFTATSCALNDDTPTTNTTTAPSPILAPTRGPTTTNQTQAPVAIPPSMINQKPPTQAPVATDTSYSAMSTNTAFVHVVCLCSILLTGYLNGI